MSSLTTSSAATLVDVLMPHMGTSVAEGTIIEWKKAVGDAVAADETLCEISTDKVDSECPSEVAGTLAEILVQAGETIEVGTVIARITSGQTAPATRSPAAAGPSNGSVARDDSPGPRVSPVAARIAAEHDIDLRDVQGTGRGGRVRKQDLVAFIEQTPTAPADRPLHIESPYRPEPTATAAVSRPAAKEAPAPPPRDGASEPTVLSRGPLSRMRQSIARHMVDSLRTAAHCTTILEADMTAVERARREAGLTFLPFVCAAVIDTLKQYPALNATLEADELTTHADINLGVAVALGDGGNDGLIVPVIRRAQDLSVQGLGREIRDVAQRARAKQLGADEVRGGTFTITSPGAFGALISTPIISQPQVAILDIEAVVKRPVVITDQDGQDSIAIRPMAYLCLSWDHRALDGAYAAQFLAALRGRLATLESAAP